MEQTQGGHAGYTQVGLEHEPAAAESHKSVAPHHIEHRHQWKWVGKEQWTHAEMKVYQCSICKVKARTRGRLEDPDPTITVNAGDASEERSDLPPETVVTVPIANATEPTDPTTGDGGKGKRPKGKTVKRRTVPRKPAARVKRPAPRIPLDLDPV